MLLPRSDGDATLGKRNNNYQEGSVIDRSMVKLNEALNPSQHHRNLSVFLASLLPLETCRAGENKQYMRRYLPSSRY